MTAACKAPERIVVIGGGKMGEAIFSGWLDAKSGPAAGIEASDVLVVDPGEARRSFLEGEYGVASVADASQVPADFSPDLVVLSVKPQVMMDVLDVVRTAPAFQGGQAGPLFVSIAAGLSTDGLRAALPDGAPLVRVMPNMPLMVGEGASGMCAAAGTDPSYLELVCELFASLGCAVIVDERDMDAVCAVSGSGPAYVAAFVESLRDAASARGLAPELAEKLALQTVLGTVRFIEEKGVSLAEARESICSPGGTTLAALDAMAQSGFAESIDAGVAAAIRRSKELGSCSS